MAETTQGALEAEMKEIFVPYRGFFNRNAVSNAKHPNFTQKTMLPYQDCGWVLVADGMHECMIQSRCQQVEVFEVVLEEADVSKAILGYITANKIQSIALGGACRNAFTKYSKPSIINLFGSILHQLTP